MKRSESVLFFVYILSLNITHQEATANGCVYILLNEHTSHLTEWHNRSLVFITEWSDLLHFLHTGVSINVSIKSYTSYRYRSYEVALQIKEHKKEIMNSLSLIHYFSLSMSFIWVLHFWFCMWKGKIHTISYKETI